MSEKTGATPTIIITPSSPSSELDFQILHIPPPPPKSWSACLRLPWSRQWSKHGPIALDSPPLDGVQTPPSCNSKPSCWLPSRVRLRTAMMIAVPLVVVAAHVVIARNYGLSLSLDFGSHDTQAEWYVGTGSEMHSEA